MLRRGKGLWAKTKAQKTKVSTNNLLLIGVAFIALLIAMAFVPAQALGTASGLPTAEEVAAQEAKEAAAVAAAKAKAAKLAAAKRHYRASVKHRKKAHRWNHKLGRGHLKFTHGRMVFSGSLFRENKRRIAWKNKAQRLYRAHVRKIRIQKQRISK